MFNILSLLRFVVLSSLIHLALADLPVIDLRYEIYQAVDSGNVTNSYYTFSNIRYAAPPTGSLRWREPVLPKKNRTSIQRNSQVITCPQGTPTWQIRTSSSLNAYLDTGVVPNISYSNLTTMLRSGQEDCLFLDVFAPKTVFDNVESGRQLPVLVWIHGGGFTTGSKTDFGSPRTLLNRAAEHDNPVVYVALNYRVGAFGFLAGPSYESQGGLLNAGLFDQRMALQWIQDNIHRFGGDRNQVTVFGESGGSGSILHHITAGGGAIKPLFSRAILQSPAYFPYRSSSERQTAFDLFMGHANVTSLEQARKLPSELLITANARSIGESLPYHSPIYGPTPDGTLVLDDPKAHLRRGEFAKRVDIITAHNSDEGLVLVPAIHTDDEYRSLLQMILTKASSSTIDYIVDTLYPPIFDGSHGYRNNFERAAKTAGELIIDSNAVSTGLAFGRHAQGYYFSTYPGIHAQDITYTFYTPGGNPSYSLIDTGPVNTTVAHVLQDYITSFAANGDPVSEVDGLNVIPPYVPFGVAVQLDSVGVNLTRDPAMNARCVWWAANVDKWS
ncbi:Alpha/Beta hydrolase protein [Aspergillus pseudodeflectus]|uniref:Carboxylic ester hydrolase n=1 Tax=Aspergillus pseudodeflectus TaxID=176178 RepID=A0ABR4L4V0_9EURO